jgi:hypothetical protein
MRLSIALLAAAAAIAGASGAQAASVEIKDAAVRVTVIPEARSDVKVEVTQANPRLPLTVRTEGDRTVVDGGLWNAIRGCGGGQDHPRVRVRDVGDLTADQLPQVVIHTPAAVELSSNGAVVGSIGRSSGVALRNSGCSHWTIADVTGQASIHESGAGSIRMGSADRLEVRISGASHVHATQVRQVLDAVLSGAGGINVDQVSGTVTTQVSGVGHINLEGGRTASLRAAVSGMGGVEFGGQTDSLDASISGMGGIRVKQVNGPLRKSVSGMGHVSIGD